MIPDHSRDSRSTWLASPELGYGAGVLGTFALLLLAAIAALALALWRARHGPVAVPDDVPGMRSALVLELADGAAGGVSAEVLDAIARALEAARIEVAPWSAPHDGALELGGLVDDDPFLVTLGPIGGARWQLHVYAQPLGGPRYAAPPRTVTMQRLLAALDRAVRRAPGVRVIGWQRRQDSFRGEPVFYEAPTD